MGEVKEWLIKSELGELVERFESQKLNTFQRLGKLSAEDIKELVPEVGLRLDFIDYLDILKEKAGSKSLHASKQNAVHASKHVDVNIGKSSPFVIQNNQQASRVEDHSTGDQLLGNNSELLTANSDSCGSVYSLQSDGSSISFVNLEGSLLDSDHNSKEDSGIEDSSCAPKQAPSEEARTKDQVVKGCKRKETRQTSLPNKRITKHISIENMKELNLEVFLKQNDLKSAAAVQNYQTEGAFTEQDRSAVVNAVANELLKHNHTPSDTEYLVVTQKICDLFPAENAATYYCPPDKNCKNATGKLPHKVKNIKFCLKKKNAGSLLEAQVAAQKSSHKAEKKTKEVTLPGSTDAEGIEVKKAISILKHESRDNLPQILSSWSVTHPMRRNALLNTRPKPVQQSNAESEDEVILVNEYFLQWDILKLPSGFLLLKQDFKELYPDSEDSLLTKWQASRDVIVDLVERELGKCDDYGRKLIDLYKEAPADKRDVIAFYLLPSLCCKKSRGGGKSSHLVPSLQEARRAFILHVQIPGDLNRAVKNQHLYFKALNLRLQPLLIFVGPTLASITGCYVQIDTIRYNLRTPLAALDCCFKAYFALDAAYPSDCKAVWLFLQKYFYNLNLEEDENISRVNSVISSLRGFASKKT